MWRARESVFYSLSVIVSLLRVMLKLGVGVIVSCARLEWVFMRPYRVQQPFSLFLEFYDSFLQGYGMYFYAGVAHPSLLCFLSLFVLWVRVHYVSVLKGLKEGLCGALR